MILYRETKTPVSIFTPEQIAGLLKKADVTLRPYLALGAFAGLRTAELQRLDWSEIDLNRGYITVAASKAKTRQRRLIPISDNLKLWLTPSRKVSGPVCLHANCQHAARVKCEGFTWAKNKLRHSYISYRLAILHDTARVALEAGNSPEVIFGHYRELVTPEAAKAWFEIKPCMNEKKLRSFRPAPGQCETRYAGPEASLASIFFLMRDSLGIGRASARLTACCAVSREIGKPPIAESCWTLVA